VFAISLSNSARNDGRHQPMVQTLCHPRGRARWSEALRFSEAALDCARFVTRYRGRPLIPSVRGRKCSARSGSGATVTNSFSGRLLAIACAGLVADLVIQPFRALRDLPDTDFVNFVAAARLLRSGACLYCIVPQEAASQAVIGGPFTTHIVVFVSPPVVGAAFTPLAMMDPHAALGVFLAFSLAALAIAGWLIASRWLPDLSPAQRVFLAIAGVASVPAAWGIAIGQLDPLLFCAVVAGITISRRHPIAGGMLIGVLALKPQLFVLIPIALILGRNWRLVAGVAISVAALALSTLLLMGWTHVLDWPRFALSKYITVPSQSISVPLSIGRVVGWGTLSTILSLLLFGVGAVLLWRRRGQLSDVGTAVALGLTLTMLASPHLLAYDTLFLTIPLAWMARHHWALAVALLLALSPAYLIDGLIAPATSLRTGSVGTSVMESLLLIGVAVAVVGRSGDEGRPRRFEPGSRTRLQMPGAGRHPSGLVS
jgi:Glycosyltransferase family 87